MIHVPRYIENLLQQKIIRYFLVGSTAAFFDITIFFFFAKLLNYNYLIVGTFGFLGATLINYLLSIRFVFISNIRFNTKTELMLIYFVSVIGLTLNLILLYLLIDVFNIEKMLSKIFATGSVFLWNFLARNYFVFKDSDSKK